MATEKKIRPYDYFRDSNTRFLGYAHTFGETIRPFIPGTFVHACYILAVSYCFADIYDKAAAQHYKDKKNTRKIMVKAGDAFYWQSFASLCLPSYAVGRVMWVGNRMLRSTRLRRGIGQLLPSVMGLMSIPILVEPIDNFVDYVMDNTYRKVFK